MRILLQQSIFILALIAQTVSSMDLITNPMSKTLKVSPDLFRERFFFFFNETRDTRHAHTHTVSKEFL